jgi:hypothetical protein
MFTAETNLALNEEIVFRTNKDGTIVVMKMDDDEVFYKIDGVAAEIWQKISSKEANLGSIASTLSEEYEVSAQKIIEDAQPFLEKVTSLNLLKIS